MLFPCQSLLGTKFCRLLLHNFIRSNLLHQTRIADVAEEKDKKIARLKKELLECQASLEEQNGASTHWKLRCDDKTRELRDLDERRSVDVRGESTQQ